MKDLKGQLASAFGRELPKEAPKKLSDDAPPEAMKDGAHLGSAWHQRLSQLARGFSSVQLAPKPKLGQARQASDQLVKLLKKGGRGRDAKELAQLRDAFMKKREQAAWTAVKDRFATHELPDKAYRALKQSKVDPHAVLTKLERQGSSLSGMSAKRLRDALS
ncbi:MAG: hypothetical protein GY913_24770 [Proteobacteria bacterium]|nr:hypothetical protein [Pseudomonadota bacterium]MCP4920129.1 hypothetical protein [Pseudomonadota bacterium]